MNSTKNTLYLSVCVCLLLSVSTVRSVFSQEMPDFVQINTLARKTNTVFNKFMDETVLMRLKYEYYGRLSQTKDREKMRIIALETTKELSNIGRQQLAYKKQMEGYRGRDWNKRFSETGLWRKLDLDIYITTFTKFQADLYLAMVSNTSEKKALFRKITEAINKIDAKIDSPQLLLLSGQTLSLLQQADSKYRRMAEDHFSIVTKWGDISDSFYLRAAIEHIRLTGEIKEGQLNSIRTKMASSPEKISSEMTLSLALLHRKMGHIQGLAEMTALWPHIKDTLGNMILTELNRTVASKSKRSNKRSLQKISLFEAQLAVQSAWNENAAKYETLLRQLTENRDFQTPLILYVTATTIAESSPEEAVELLVKASKIQNRNNSNLLNLSAKQIAAQAAKMASTLITNNTTDCPDVIRTFDNYNDIARHEPNEEMEYLYANVLSNCERTTKSRKLLQKIAKKQGKWSYRARFDIILQELGQGETSLQRRKILAELYELIQETKDLPQNKYSIHDNAVTVYCHYMFKDENSAQKIMDVLTSDEIARDPNLNIYKAKALYKLGMLEDAVNSLSYIISAESCEHSETALEMLSDVIEKLDEFQSNSNKTVFRKKLKHYAGLAGFCWGCLEAEQKKTAALFLTEIEIFANYGNKAKLNRIKDSLANHDTEGSTSNAALLRCKARLAMMTDIKTAAELWAKIADLNRTRRNQEFWRAKYFELLCWSKLSQSQNSDIVHAIDVLQNSNEQIPEFWGGKLTKLKDQLSP